MYVRQLIIKMTLYNLETSVKMVLLQVGIVLGFFLLYILDGALIVYVPS